MVCSKCSGACKISSSVSEFPHLLIIYLNDLYADQGLPLNTTVADVSRSVILPTVCSNTSVTSWRLTIQSVQIRLDTTWYLQTCYKLFKQLASSLWIKSLDNQLASNQICWQLNAADLLSSSRSKRCERILISAWWLPGNKPAAHVLKAVRLWLGTRLISSRTSLFYARNLFSLWRKLILLASIQVPCTTARRWNNSYDKGEPHLPNNSRNPCRRH